MPDKAASTAPYFTPAFREAGVKAALAVPSAFTVVTTLVPVRSVRPKTLATAVLVWFTVAALIEPAGLLAPAKTAPALLAAKVVSALIFKVTVPPADTPTAIKLAFRSLVSPVASSLKSLPRLLSSNFAMTTPV